MQDHPKHTAAIGPSGAQSVPAGGGHPEAAGLPVELDRPSHGEAS